MANEAIPFDRSISAKPEELQSVSPLVRRLIANNGGPFTFTGTCTYIVGHGDATIVDPGPADPAHLRAILEAVRGERVSRIVLTHRHLDHCGGANALREQTGAAIIACRERPALSEAMGLPVLDASSDPRCLPDRIVGDGDVIEAPDHRLQVISTPGHAADHLVFALDAEQAVFSGDHVMAWSTTVVVPPDGSMSAYMASLRKLLGRDDAVYWPGHGGPIHAPKRFVSALLVHRQWREAAIVRCLAAGDATVATIVSHIYRGLAPSLRAAAGQSVLAHLIDLVARGEVVAEGPPAIQTRYALPSNETTETRLNRPDDRS